MALKGIDWMLLLARDDVHMFFSEAGRSRLVLST